MPEGPKFASIFYFPKKTIETRFEFFLLMTFHALQVSF